MLQTHPNPPSVLDQPALAACIGARFECRNGCTSCAEACPAEGHPLTHLAHFIRLHLDCAGVCGATGRVLPRLTQPDLTVVRAARVGDEHGALRRVRRGARRRSGEARRAGPLWGA